jgi:transposase-like protein
MSQRAATVTCLAVAFEIVKAMQADGLDWGEDHRRLGRQALEAIIEDQMTAMAERYFEQIEADAAADRRNGYYRRHLLTATKSGHCGNRAS